MAGAAISPHEHAAARVAIPLPEVLPQRFTFEADYNGSNGWGMKLNFADPDVVDDPSAAVFSPTEGGFEGDKVSRGHPSPTTPFVRSRTSR